MRACVRAFECVGGLVFRSRRCVHVDANPAGAYGGHGQGGVGAGSQRGNHKPPLSKQGQGVMDG